MSAHDESLSQMDPQVTVACARDRHELCRGTRYSYAERVADQHPLGACTCSCHVLDQHEHVFIAETPGSEWSRCECGARSRT